MMEDENQVKVTQLLRDLKPHPEGEMSAELLPCPFCGRPATRTFTCGPAIPNCPRCADIFGCNHCDIWFDTAVEWNARQPDRVSELEAENAELKELLEQKRTPFELMELMAQQQSRTAQVDAENTRLRAMLDNFPMITDDRAEEPK